MSLETKKIVCKTKMILIRSQLEKAKHDKKIIHKSLLNFLAHLYNSNQNFEGKKSRKKILKLIVHYKIK
jgi:hypothetical protein